jgi:hypothetical protein
MTEAKLFCQQFARVGLIEGSFTGLKVHCGPFKRVQMALSGRKCAFSEVFVASKITNVVAQRVEPLTCLR